MSEAELARAQLREVIRVARSLDVPLNWGVRLDCASYPGEADLCVIVATTETERLALTAGLARALGKRWLWLSGWALSRVAVPAQLAAAGDTVPLPAIELEVTVGSKLLGMPTISLACVVEARQLRDRALTLFAVARPDGWPR